MQFLGVCCQRLARATLSLTSTVSSATVQASPESGKVSSVSTDVPLSGERRTHSMPTCGETPPTQSSIEEAPPTMSAGGEAPPLKLAGEKQTWEMESIVTKQDIPTETPPTETPPTETPPTATSAEVAPLIAEATRRKASPTESPKLRIVTTPTEREVQMSVKLKTWRWRRVWRRKN